MVLEEARELLVALDEEKFVQKASLSLLQAAPYTAAEHSAVQLFLRQLIRSQSFSEHLLTVAQDVES